MKMTKIFRKRPVIWDNGSLLCSSGKDLKNPTGTKSGGKTCTKKPHSPLAMNIDTIRPKQATQAGPLMCMSPIYLGSILHTYLGAMEASEMYQ